MGLALGVELLRGVEVLVEHQVGAIGRGVGLVVDPQDPEAGLAIARRMRDGIARAQENKRKTVTPYDL